MTINYEYTEISDIPISGESNIIIATDPNLPVITTSQPMIIETVSDDEVDDIAMFRHSRMQKY